MFARRVLTAAVLLALLLAGALLFDKRLFAAVIAAVVGAGAHEWARLTGLQDWRAAAYALAQIIVFGIAWRMAAAPSDPASLAACWGLAALIWLVIIPFWLARGVHAKARIGLRAAGFAVLTPAALAMVALPPTVMFSLLGIVWIADTAAYLIGSAIGRRRLAPAISPGKTWEGAIGGMLACLAYAIILGVFWPGLGARVAGAGWALFLAGVALLCVMSILGDLFESAMKRQAGVKDSGTLLPGHGGVLDRIDSAIAVLPLGALLAVVAGLA